MVPSERRKEQQPRRLALSLPTLPKIEPLQAALHAKAKGSPTFRFYSLYDKVYRPDVLWQAYQ